MNRGYVYLTFVKVKGKKKPEETFTKYLKLRLSDGGAVDGGLTRRGKPMGWARGLRSPSSLVTAHTLYTSSLSGMKRIEKKKRVVTARRPSEVDWSVIARIFGQTCCVYALNSRSKTKSRFYFARGILESSFPVFIL